MMVRIPGNISVSHDFFEEGRDDLELVYDVTIDTGPGGVVEVDGSDDRVLFFLNDRGIDLSDVEQVV